MHITVEKLLLHNFELIEVFGTRVLHMNRNSSHQFSLKGENNGIQKLKQGGFICPFT